MCAETLLSDSTHCLFSSIQHQSHLDTNELQSYFLGAAVVLALHVPCCMYAARTISHCPFSPPQMGRKRAPGGTLLFQLSSAVHSFDNLTSLIQVV